MAKSKAEWGIGRLILEIALGCMLAVAGIWALQGGGDAGVKAVKDIFEGSVEDIFVVVFGIIELLAGILLILRPFIGKAFAKFDDALMLIIMIVWIIAIVLCDFLGHSGLFNGGAKHFLDWLYDFACHMIVLGAIITLR